MQHAPIALAHGLGALINQSRNEGPMIEKFRPSRPLLAWVRRCDFPQQCLPVWPKLPRTGRKVAAQRRWPIATRAWSALRRLVILGIVIGQGISQRALRLAVLAAKREHALDTFDGERAIRREALRTDKSAITLLG
jgi:hypothetical protein